VNLAFIGFASAMGSMVGMVFVFFILVVAAAEAVIGLAIMVEIFRNKQTLNIDELNLLKW
jgi:NADH-quinone oxidoreductase subunit K